MTRRAVDPGKALHVHTNGVTASYYNTTGRPVVVEYRRDPPMIREG